jgi:hypothetical protein
MTFEADFQTLLKTQCARVFADVAPQGTAKPYVTWSALGGRPMRLLDNTAGNKRHTYMQVSAWASSRSEAVALIRAIEEALCASADFVATPEGEATSTYEADIPIFGSLQRFSIYSDR